MSMYEFLVKRVLTPVVDSHRGAHTMKRLEELESTQWWPREKILGLQDERLRRLVKYAYDNEFIFVAEIRGGKIHIAERGLIAFCYRRDSVLENSCIRP